MERTLTIALTPVETKDNKPYDKLSPFTYSGSSYSDLWIDTSEHVATLLPQMPSARDGSIREPIISLSKRGNRHMPRIQPYKEWIRTIDDDTFQNILASLEEIECGQKFLFEEKSYLSRRNLDFKQRFNMFERIFSDLRACYTYLFIGSSTNRKSEHRVFFPHLHEHLSSLSRQDKRFAGVIDRYFPMRAGERLIKDIYNSSRS